MTPAPLRRAFIATDILHAYRRAETDAMAFISGMSSLGRLHISEYSAMALIANAPDERERNGLGMFFLWCEIHAITAWISKRAHRLLQQLAPPSGLTADDAIVAATALEHKLPLYALNPTRFAAVPGMTALQPY